MATKRKKAKTDEPVVLVTSDMSEVSYTTIRELMKGEPFTMQLNRPDALTVTTAVNQGIDSHLEACFCPDLGDKYEWVLGKLHCTISEKSLPTLLRRLYASDDERAVDLADGILYSLKRPD